MRETTTDLKVIRKAGIDLRFVPFTWGRPIKLHEIGPYSILEYESIFNGKSEGICFHIWIDGSNTSRSEESLDSALALAIGYRAEGPNGKAAMYFMKMISEEKK